jgi:hypothetical protein
MTSPRYQFAASTRRVRRRADRRGGLTLVELIMALSSTALIGMAIVSMLFAVNAGTADRNDNRLLLAKHKLASTRLDASIRSAKKVLASGSGYVVLWMSDSRVNSLPNLSELRRIEYDSSTKTLKSYKAVFPSSWTAAAITAADTTYQLTDNFATTTAALKGTSTFPSETWCSSVSGLTVTLDNATAQSAKLVSYRAGIIVGSGTTAVTGTVIGAAALRAP